MIWLSEISKLGYYNKCSTIPCYCEALLYPEDLMLQGTIPAGQGTGNYGISIEVWSADGTTALEADNTNFSYYFFVNPITQIHTFNIRLKRFTTAMCANKCFLIRVAVWNSGNPDAFLFANWTEQYCIADCCEYAHNVRITQSDTEIKTSSDNTVVTTNLTKACETNIIRLISDTACINNQNGKYYYLPTSILSGSASFQYADVLNMRGKFRQLTREIEVQRSFNCNLQRTQSTRQYQLEGWEYFPEWKMNEIEDMLHTEYISITDFDKYNTTYNFAGGTPFEDKRILCCDVWKLNAVFTGCETRQTFGCDTSCNTPTYYYVIPQEGIFYSDNGTKIANDIDGLLQWFQSQNGVIDASEYDLTNCLVGSPPVLPCDIEAIISFQTSGVVPSSLYINTIIQPNRIYAIQSDNICEICDTIGTTPCDTPILGTPVITEIECDTPVLGTPTIEEITPEVLGIFEYGNWVNVSPPVLEAVGYANSVTFSLELINTTDFTGTAGEVIEINSIVAYITGNGVPTVSQVITYDDDITVTIDTQGYITVVGQIALTDVNEATIILTNVTYQLT